MPNEKPNIVPFGKHKAKTGEEILHPKLNHLAITIKTLIQSAYEQGLKDGKAERQTNPPPNSPPWNSDPSPPGPPWEWESNRK